MTKNNYFKQEVRARMAATGESYSVAARAVASSNVLPTSEVTSSSQNTISLRSLILFTETAAALVATGMDVSTAFTIIAEQTTDQHLKEDLLGVVEDLASRETFSAAIGKRPRSFPGILPSLVNNNYIAVAETFRIMAKLLRTELELDLLVSPDASSGSKPSSDLKAHSQDSSYRDADRTLASSRDQPSKGQKLNWQKSDERPLAVFVGDYDLATNFASIKDGWKFTYYATVFDFESELEEGMIDNTEVCAVLVEDKLYQDLTYGNNFERLAARISPYCFFGIALQNASLKPLIDKAVQLSSRYVGEPEGKIFFIDALAPKDSLDRAIRGFLQLDSRLAEHAVKTLRG